MQGFSIGMCDWLMPPGSGQRQARVSVSDSLKRRELLEDFVYWFFESFILTLLKVCSTLIYTLLTLIGEKTTFYITESSAYRMQVLYFRQDDWQQLCAPLLKHLTSNTYHKLEPVNIVSAGILRTLSLWFDYRKKPNRCYAIVVWGTRLYVYYPKRWACGRL